MERRQFIKSIAAAASSPLLPVGVLKGAQLSPSLYANAVTFASSDAYFSAKYLKSSLGLDDKIGEMVLSRLKEDGLVGDMGRSGLMFSKTFYSKHIELAAHALQSASRAQSDAKTTDLMDRLKETGSDTEEFEPTIENEPEQTLDQKPEIDAKPEQKMDPYEGPETDNTARPIKV